MQTFEEWWDSSGSKATPETYKGWEQSCREAWNASEHADCRTCMNFQPYQSACNSISRCQGEECLDGDLYEKKQALKLWAKSVPNEHSSGETDSEAGGLPTGAAGWAPPSTEIEK